jgi:hypothetical protein
MKNNYYFLLTTLIFLLTSCTRNISKPINSQSQQISNKVAYTFTPTPTVIPQKTETTEKGINFIKSGVLLNFDSKTENTTSSWTFVYEEPGAPGLKTSLTFDSQSLCTSSDNSNLSCREPYIQNGTRVKIEGHKNDDNVFVIQLTILE